jgi:hypothetical protein
VGRIRACSESLARASIDNASDLASSCGPVQREGARAQRSVHPFRHGLPLLFALGSAVVEHRPVLLAADPNT